MEDLYSARSEEVQEILGTPPKWIIRWGTVVILFALIAAGILAWNFKYPDKVVDKLTLTTMHPPVPIFAQSEGYLEQLFVMDGDSVDMGDVLALLQDEARYDDILQLEKDLEELKAFDQDAFTTYSPNRTLELGALQTSYSSFVRLIQDFSFTSTTDHDENSTRQLRKQISRIQQNLRSLNTELEKANEAKVLAQQQFEKLHNNYTGNLEDLKLLEAARQNLLEKEKEIASIEGDIAARKTDIDDLKVQILYIKQGKESGSMSKYQALRQSITQLSAEVQTWKQQYLLTAQTAGTVSFYNIQRERQYLKKGDKVLAILPYQEYDNFIGEVLLPVEGSGKVEEGQRVLIKFESYPFQEFGYVEGKVGSKALLPQNDEYFVKVLLPNGLLTNYNKELTFRQQMTAQVEIITEDKRFLERVLEKMLGIFA